MAGNEIRVVRSDVPVESAAAALTEALRATLREREHPRLAIPGGSAAQAVGLVRSALGPEWSRLALTWVDERCVPFDHRASNRGQAHRDGHLDEGDPPALTLALVEDGEVPARSARRSAQALAEGFENRLDVVLLGMGEDGHIASLFVGRRTDPLATVIHVTRSPKPPADRVTLTRRVLATARRTVLLATGEGKREALRRVVAGDPDLPAVGLPGLELHTDQHLGDES
ncbi:MAG: 6-phosphogluconolactonase [Sandaracinaceae bacterium]